MAHYRAGLILKIGGIERSGGRTGAAVAGVEKIGGAVAVGEADAGGSFQEEEVGLGVPRELVEVQARGRLVYPERTDLLGGTVGHG